MRPVKTLKDGSIYHVETVYYDKRGRRKIGEKFDGILIKQENHIGKNSPCLLFYTLLDERKDLYQEDADIYNGVKLSEKAKALLKEFYEVSVKLRALHQKQSELASKTYGLKIEQAKIGDKLLSLAGIEKDGLIGKDQSERIEEVFIQERIEDVCTGVAKGIKEIKESEQCERLLDKLSVIFDHIWEQRDQRHKKVV